MSTPTTVRRRSPGSAPNNGPQGGTNSVIVDWIQLDRRHGRRLRLRSPGTAISAVTAGSLTVIAPAGTGAVDVTVTTANGTSAVNAPSDQYTYNPAPTVTGVTPNNGPQAGGNSVTVAGTGFASGSTGVDFGSTAGTTVTVTSPTSLTVIAPAGTGVVDVTVTTANGTSVVNALASDQYTYNPPPTVTGLSPTNGPAGGGTSVTVSGTNLTGATAVHFGSIAGTSISADTAGSLTVIAPAGTGVVDVTVTTPNGTSAVNAPSDQYTYNPAPTVTGVTPNNGAPAGGNSVTVNGTNLSGATAVHFGSIAGTSISADTAGSLTVVVPAGTGTVDVTVTTANGTSAVNAPSDEYTYNGPPTVTGLTPNNGPQGGTNSVIVDGSNLSGATAVHFGSIAGTSISADTAGSLTVIAPAGTGVVDVTVTTANGTSAVNAPSDQYTYNAPPTVTGVSPDERTSGPAGHRSRSAAPT